MPDPRRARLDVRSVQLWSLVWPMSDHRPRIGDLSLAARLRRELEGEVLFDPVSRGLYSTDASIYQIEPVGVVVPRTVQDVKTAIGIAVQEGVPVLPRGAGTSQGGQAVGRALVVDTSKHLRAIAGLDREAGTVRVEPGVVLDDLNRWLAPHGLFYPVDVATSSRATLGGMAGNNSSGARSIRYGIMADRVRAIDAVLADGSERFVLARCSQGSNASSNAGARHPGEKNGDAGPRTRAPHVGYPCPRGG